MTLQNGAKITPQRPLLDIQINQWKYAGDCDGVGGCLMPGVELEVVEVCLVPGAMWTRVKLPGAYPPKFLKMTSLEFAYNFTVK